MKEISRSCSIFFPYPRDQIHTDSHRWDGKVWSSHFGWQDFMIKYCYIEDYVLVQRKIKARKISFSLTFSYYSSFECATIIFFHSLVFSWLPYFKWEDCIKQATWKLRLLHALHLAKRIMTNTFCHLNTGGYEANITHKWSVHIHTINHTHDNRHLNSFLLTFTYGVTENPRC